MKSKRGITLIALVITIIVLLVLAGVSLSLVLGENGVLKQTQNATTETRSAEEKEKIEMAVAAAQMAGNGVLIKENLNSQLQDTFDNNIEVEESSYGWSYHIGEVYRIYKNGDVVKEKEYVQNGLVCWVDGILNSKENDGIIVDQTGNYSINNNKTLYAKNTTINHENYIFFNNSRYDIACQSIITNNNLTIEAVVKRGTTPADYYMIGCSDYPAVGRFNFGWDTANQIRYWQTSDIYRGDSIDNQVNSISVVFDGSSRKIYINGEYSGEFKFENGQADEILILGGYGINSAYYGNFNLYSLRIYDKSLSANEIFLNHEIDKIRFNM